MSDHAGPHPPRARARQTILAVALAAALALLTLSTAHGSEGSHGAGGEPGPDDQPPQSQRDLAEVRGAVGRYHTPARAEAAGWELVAGLDHCFANPDVGGMGYHYIDGEQLEDPTLDPLRPESLVFVPDRDGQLRLGAVEYLVPAELWDGEEPPSVLGRDLHALEPVPDVEVWGLHVWLFEHNPDGTFADWNPRVSCPS